MHNSISDVEAIRAVLGNYIEGTYTGDVDLLRAAFHPDATMSGYMMGELLQGNPEPFFAHVASLPSHEKTQKPYKAQILNIDVSGSVASALMVEESCFELNFVNYFHLLKQGEEWLIVCKLFHHG